MAIVKFSALVSGMKGKLNGSVLSHCQAGYTIKNNLNWNKKCSDNWSAQKAKLSYMAQQWRELTQGQRDGWNSGSSSFPFTDKFGNSYDGGGFQVFMSLNLALHFLGESVLTTIPTPATVADIGSLTLTTNMSGNLEAQWSTGLGGDDKVTIFASPQQSPGSASRESFKRFMVAEDSPGATEIEIENEYIAAFGTLISGSRIWIKSQSYNVTTGQHGNEYTAYYDVP